MKMHIRLLVPAAALAGLVSTRSADACFQCTSSQWCTQGNLGGACEVYSEGGRQWCQHTLDCKPSMTMTPLEISPTGTFLASGGARVVEDGLEKQQCNGYVVAHVAGSERAEDTSVIRI